MKSNTNAAKTDTRKLPGNGIYKALANHNASAIDIPSASRKPHRDCSRHTCNMFCSSHKCPQANERSTLVGGTGESTVFEKPQNVCGTRESTVFDKPLGDEIAKVLHGERQDPLEQHVRATAPLSRFRMQGDRIGNDDISDASDDESDETFIGETTALKIAWFIYCAQFHIAFTPGQWTFDKMSENDDGENYSEYAGSSESGYAEFWTNAFKKDLKGKWCDMEYTDDAQREIVVAHTSICAEEDGVTRSVCPSGSSAAPSGLAPGTAAGEAAVSVV